jgi:hypothetical protein
MIKEEFLSEREIQMELLKEVRHIKEKMQEPAKKAVNNLGFVDAVDVMQLLHISPKTLYNLCKKNLLRSAKVEGKLYFKLSDIKEMLEEQFKRS